MVWLSLILTILLLATSTAFSWFKYSALRDNPTTNTTISEAFHHNPLTQDWSVYLELRDTWLVFFIGSAALLGIVLLITLILRSRIRIATALITEASKAVGSILTSVFFPIITFILQLTVMGWFLTVSVYLISSKNKQYRVQQLNDDCLDKDQPCDPEQYNSTTSCQCEFYRLAPDARENYLQLYNIAGLFWGLCFTAALGEMVLAGAFSAWYWLLDKSKLAT